MQRAEWEREILEREEKESQVAQITRNPGTIQKEYSRKTRNSDNSLQLSLDRNTYNHCVGDPKKTSIPKRSGKSECHSTGRRKKTEQYA